ncbi:DUF2892 domain-containing protein [Proteinivorax hydrogeniformans]|uniref:DUF2892 domain-containing protein n=1 Tax=Proteinivorax hydrogeniformans TaxID=1826727 RepID=A0AAU8HS27_9FIRM
MRSNFRKNVGDVDRVIRISLGSIFIIIGALNILNIHHLVAYFLVIAGLVNIAEGLIRY